MPKHIVVPDEREAQLRQIAATHNVSVADAVGLLFGWAVEQGRVPAAIPTIDVSRVGDTVVVDFGEFQRTMPLDLAKAFATSLRWFSTTKAKGIPAAVTELAQALSGSHLVGISRRGTSIKIAGGTGKERTLAPSIARELAGLIERSASEAPL
ncbi:hypothetical protein [Devosia sp. SL43]|uniref:hypothetical protein n=1 Tax=Devosia sp. SL43 TaxID=2806348 RepID=UPI001F224CEF|nr:hypothetical protein [Devosia sp. SL43]UJW85769.1 hypothetical protein IM737_00220 [Devosia sp. SL43]